LEAANFRHNLAKVTRFEDEALRRADAGHALFGYTKTVDTFLRGM
jgi:hypothetical protein